MFENLSERLGSVFDKLRGRGSLNEADVDAAMREIRVALLEADVALPVAKEFIERVKAQAVGQNVIKGVNPAQQVVKIVHDALVSVLGDQAQELTQGAPPYAYLMVGLQGSGKTTSTAKIAKYLTDKQRKKVLMASLDVARPAAQEQLKQLGEQTGVATLPIIPKQKPVDIAKRALDTARKEGYDVVMLDTAGRLAIDEQLMAEAKAVRDATDPVEVLLVADAMTGQDAVNTAKAFNDKIGITGVMLTRIDGDARGGAALSMRAVTGKPIKLIGTGEKWDALEPFYPDRLAGRILGMGDVVSLVEKTMETVDREQVEKMAQKFKKGEFDFNDLLSQMQQIKKMGGAGSLMKMMPGLGKMAAQLENAGVDDKVIKRQEAIIFSMTPEERGNPRLLNASRRKRIAAGSGVTVHDVNKLAKQQEQMQTIMKRMKKMGIGGLLGNKGKDMLKEMMSEEELDMMMQSMDPDALAADMARIGGEEGPGADTDDPLGANPFAHGARALPNINPFGGMPGLSGLGPVTGKKKKK